jgi:hypothetical protein
MMTDTDKPQQDTATDSRTRSMIPAVEEDTVLLKRWLRRMPFAGDTFASSCRAIEAEPLPPVNAKGGRDAEGWTAVYEVTVKPEWLNGGGGLHGAAAAWIVDSESRRGLADTSVHQHVHQPPGHGDVEPVGAQHQHRDELLRAGHDVRLPEGTLTTVGRASALRRPLSAWARRSARAAAS